MSQPLLLLGNKRYSSWSLRGYLALTAAGLAFDEKVIPLFQPDTHAQIAEIAPNAPAKVPLLVIDGHVIWDTMAIMEFAAENSRAGRLWPEDKFARAHARSVAAEMHAGFSALRENVPMNLDRMDSYTPPAQDVQADIDRIFQIWRQCRTRYQDKGPYLFGTLSMADVAFAPVLVRLKSRSIPMDTTCKAYADAAWNMPGFAKWREDAAQEIWIIGQ